ncbi:MAG: SRPBCC family protein [Acidimicrobiales bacterium]
MELTNEFEVAVPVAQAWEVLTDIERIAPCMPGAQLTEVEGDEYRGLVKVKVGPVTASYAGAARFVELDEAAHRAVLKAEGRDTRGQGNATANITATLSATEEGTKVAVSTDLAITGKVAQFGRGVLADVSGRLLDQFVDNLYSTVLSPQPLPEEAAEAEAAAEAAEAAEAEGPPESGAIAAGEEPVGTEVPPSAADLPTGARQIHSAPAEPVDLMGVAGSPVLRRVAPYLVVPAVLLVIRLVVRSLRRRRE